MLIEPLATIHAVHDFLVLTLLALLVQKVQILTLRILPQWPKVCQTPSESFPQDGGVGGASERERERDRETNREGGMGGMSRGISAGDSALVSEALSCQGMRP